MDMQAKQKSIPYKFIAGQKVVKLVRSVETA